MQLDQLWDALEAEPAAACSPGGGWTLRLARPDSGCHLFIATEQASRRRAILLRLPSESMPSRRVWPKSKGLEPLSVAIGGHPHFGVALKESRFSDVFAALAEDLCRRVAECAGPDARARAFLGQLARWQKFLSASIEGLSDEAQRGLWGELCFLRESLLPSTGPAAVAAWHGAERAHQDFQFQYVAVEVKTTLAKQPQVVRITSERQLDDSAWSMLFLSVIALDARDGGGETLPEMVGSMRNALSDGAAREAFEDHLLAAGYLDVHSARYAARGYTVRSSKLFRVSQGFPRIIERDLPSGVGDANYGLSVSSCDSFAVPLQELASSLASTLSPKTKSKGRRHA